jgi:hypothetical protein
MDTGQLAHRFAYHPPSDPSIASKHEVIREACGALAQLLNEVIDKECREKSLATTSLEEVMFWANAAVARELNYRGDSPATPPVMTQPGCAHPGCILAHPHAGPAVVGEKRT